MALASRKLDAGGDALEPGFTMIAEMMGREISMGELMAVIIGAREIELHETGRVGILFWEC